MSVAFGIQEVKDFIVVNSIVVVYYSVKNS